MTCSTSEVALCCSSASFNLRSISAIFSFASAAEGLRRRAAFGALRRLGFVVTLRCFFIASPANRCTRRTQHRDRTLHPDAATWGIEIAKGSDADQWDRGADRIVPTGTSLPPFVRLGQKRPMHSAPVPNNVRYASNSDRSRHEFELTRCANSRHRASGPLKNQEAVN